MVVWRIMLPDVVASAIAADSLGYHSVARLIIEQQLSPAAIARLFAMSASPDAGHVAAVVILAAATARFNSCRQGFNGSVERDLALRLLGGETLLAKADKQAVAIVRDHWREITAARAQPWPVAVGELRGHPPARGMTPSVK
jgi:hypothetical protein